MGHDDPLLDGGMEAYADAGSLSKGWCWDWDPISLTVGP